MGKSKRFLVGMAVVIFMFLISNGVEGFIPDSSVSNKQKSASSGPGSGSIGVPVPDSKTAIKIATETWTQIYGAENVAKQKPFVAELWGETWYVHGSIPVGLKSPVYGMQINKKDGKIVRVTKTGGK